MAQILVVDDEIGIRELLSEILADEGHQVMLAESAGDARRLRERARPDLVLLDIWMPDADGITLLKEWAASGQLTMPVVMMSGHATIETAVEATRIGALDFLEKPIALDRARGADDDAADDQRRVVQRDAGRGGGETGQGVQQGDHDRHVRAADRQHDHVAEHRGRDEDQDEQPLRLRAGGDRHLHGRHLRRSRAGAAWRPATGRAPADRGAGAARRR